jgi:hypothetical protein
MNTAVCNSCSALPSLRSSAKRTLHHLNFRCDAPHAENMRLLGAAFDGRAVAAVTPAVASWCRKLLNHNIDER